MSPMTRFAAAARAARIGAALAGIGLALGVAAPASAHAALVATDPAADTTLATAPPTVSATFSEVLDGPSTEIALTDAAGTLIAIGPPAFDGATFTQPMRYSLPGSYTLAFRVISEDGHRVDGAVHFTVEDIPADLVDADAAARSADLDATGSTDPAASDAASAKGSGGTGTAAIIASAAMAALAVAAGAVWLRRRRTTRP